MNDFDTLCDPLNSSKFYKSSELTEFTHSELDSGIRKLRPMKKLKSLRPQKRFKRTGSIAKAKSLVQLRRANAWKRLKLRDQPVRIFQEENENTMKQPRNVYNYRLKEGNSVSGTLPPTLDSFLQDIAQITGMIDYADIMNFGARATVEDVKKLRKLYKAAQEAAEYDDEDDYNDIARDVRKVVVADDLDSTREMILEAMLKEFGCRNCYMGEYEAANWLGISDDELDDWIHEVYDYMSEDSDYLCRDCMYTEVTKAIKAWHEDNWDSEDDLDESYKRDRTLDEGRAKPFIVVKILDKDDSQAEKVLASYGGQLDDYVWEIARYNIDDIKEAIPNWQKRLSFYTSYDYPTGTFGSKCRSKEFKAEACNAPRR